MKYLPKYILTLFLLMGSIFHASATHIRAGEIVIQQLDDCGLTIKAVVLTYAKASMNAADEDTIIIDWGDGLFSSAGRVNGPGNKGEFIGNDIKLNRYEAFHTYSGRATYVISTTDHNRNAGIINIPNSVFIPMHISTTYTFLNPQFQGCNSTPVILQPPIDFGCVGKKFVHNPNAFDPDGDSLAFFLTKPLFSNGTPVPGFVFPNAINPGPDNTFSVDPLTGDVTWDAPQMAGEYNIALYIIEYRNGMVIDTTIRDMQIMVEDCNNNPPEIETSEDLCVIAGDSISFDVIGTDPDSGQLVKINALGGPFVTDYSPATFSGPTDYETPPVIGHFFWPTTCEHISNQEYSVVFKAQDNFFGDTGLSTLKQVRIKVVGPPPLDLIAEADDEQIKLSWESPYSCEDAADDYFRTFTVWRKQGSHQFPLDTCAPGLAGKGYTKISPSAKELVGNRYVFIDTNVEKGRTYCYRIVAEFARISAGGYPYNLVESLPSNEACVQLGRDIPLITKVSVLSTDNSNGDIQVEWTKPIADDLDTLQNPGPYTYEVQREVGINSVITTPVPGASFTRPDFASANDTSYLDGQLNTQANPYSYRIAFYVNGETTPLGYAEPAASIFLSVTPSDKKNYLSWQEMVPWDNYSFTIFRKDLNTGLFDSIGSTTDLTYTDEGLENGTEYCYYIKSFGSYGVSDIASPLINLSQQACAAPKDDVPPCPPKLSVVNICSDNGLIDSDGHFYNLLNWTNPKSWCNDKDLAGFKLYFSPLKDGDLQLIETLTDTTFNHYPNAGIAGCYAITAFDSTGNESAIDTVLCVDNCPTYELPNTFTPNGDGQNDEFVPFPYHFIAKVDLKVFNQWGNLVFETTDPAIKWDGTSKSGQQLATGTYFYTCSVLENRVTGVNARPDLLTGYIELIRN